MNLNTTKHFINELDRARLLSTFHSYFKSTNNIKNNEALGPLIKKEMCELHTMRRLVLYTGFEIEEFVYHTAALYPHLFNKAFTRKVRNNVKLGFD
jgi:hypothetical protein